MAKISGILEKILLTCGILSSILYVSTDIIGGILWEGYDFTAQYVSELTAIGSPSRFIVFPFFIVDNLLVIAFGFGVWISANKKKTIQMVGYLLEGIGITGLITTLFFPIHLNDAEKNYTDTMHVIFSVIGVILILFAIGLTITAFKNWFRFFAIGILLTFAVPALISFLIGLEVIVERSNSWVGIMERINIYGYLLWVIVFAVILLFAEKNTEMNLELVKVNNEIT